MHRQQSSTILLGDIEVFRLHFTTPYRSLEQFSDKYYLRTWKAQLTFCRPLLGGLDLEAKGWRGTQWVTIFFILAFYLPIVFTKETYKKTILQKGARSLRTQNSTTGWGSALSSIKYFATTLLIRPVRMIFTKPIVTLVWIYNASSSP
jgi:hypothetical protein